jgi:sensor domain CHASE-containing protein
LEDLHILDYLELAGSQYKAARALEMHQTTVCRSLQLMQRQFSLIGRVPWSGVKPEACDLIAAL